MAYMVKWYEFKANVAAIITSAKIAIDYNTGNILPSLTVSSPDISSYNVQTVSVILLSWILRTIFEYY